MEKPHLVQAGEVKAHGCTMVCATLIFAGPVQAAVTVSRTSNSTGFSESNGVFVVLDGEKIAIEHKHR